MKEETNYFLALKELRNILKYTESVSLVKISKEFKLPTTFSKILIEGKIVKKIGELNNGKYTWNTIEPNLAMAKKVKDECANTYKSYVEEYKDTKKVSVNQKEVRAGKNWNNKEDAYIVKNRGNLSYDVMSEKLGRTKESIKSRLKILKVKSKPIKKEIKPTTLNRVVKAKEVIDKSREKVVTCSPFEVKQTKTISIFWGLFKYESK